MAISVTHILTAGTGTDANSYDTASVNLSANKLVLLAVASVSTASAPVNVPTVTGASRTWTQVATAVEPADTYRRITVFRSLSSSGNSGALTIDFAGETQLRCGWSISEFDNVDTSGTNGANAIVQSANVESGVSETTGITVTLNAFSSTDNATYGAVRKGAVGAVSPGSGFSELGEADFETGNKIQTEWKATNDTSVDWSWASESSTYPTGIAVEIKHKVASGFLALL
ncbi:MAG: hypothetical protein ACTSPI_08445 [Candidatus Heimdallarchaeaceae archaeon]